MEMTVIKWDESMAERCLARCRDDLVRAEAADIKLARKAVNDIQWEEFEKALSKALKK